MQWNFDPDTDQDDNDAPFRLVRTDETSNERRVMSEGCKGTPIGCDTSCEIRSQSLQSFTNAGRNFDAVATVHADSIVFYNNILKAAAVNEMREMGTLESRANGALLGPAPGQ